MTPLFTTYQNEIIADKALFLYHGTGGNETDLLPLVEPFLQTHTVVGIRGNVQEHGMKRYFTRFPDGTFDQESIRRESEKLQRFLDKWCENNAIAKENITHIGYSNGANFILANLLLYPESIKRAALLHPMLPLKPMGELDLSAKALFLSWAENDEMISAAESQRLLQTLKQYGTEIQEFTGTHGHRISPDEVKSLNAFVAAQS